MSHAEAHAPTSTSAKAAAEGLYGLMAEFDNPTALVEAANRARLDGYRQMDAFSPIPIHELDEALGLGRTRLPRLVLFGGIVGGLAGFSLEAWASMSGRFAAAARAAASLKRAHALAVLPSFS